MTPSADTSAGPVRPNGPDESTRWGGLARHRHRALTPSIWAPAAVAIGLAALGWQLLALHNPQDLPRIGAIWQQLSNRPGFYARNTGATMLETAVGLLASFAIAFSLAAVMCHVRLFERAVMPLAVMVNVTPVVALAPGLAIVFQFGFMPKFVVTAIIVFFPFLVNSLAGLRSVDAEALDVLRTLDASTREIFVRLRLPSSLPFLFAAARVCFPLSIVGAVVAEFVVSGTTPGLGVFISSARTQAGPYALAEIYAAIAILAAIGLALTFLVTGLEARLLSWHASARRRT